ncbi:MAG: ASKHA domain-containing protein, partial [Elusimicrobiota bacterium]|nr:ASKHA domain-containing protein [Elusimicrobiota bacterium]
TQDEIDEGYRLACCTTIRENTQVYIPPSSITEKQKLQIWGKEIKVKPFPPVRKFFLQLTKATLSDTRSDFQRIKDGLKGKYDVKVENIDSQVLNAMGPNLRDSHWSITVGVRGNEIIGVEPGKRKKEIFGIAIDLGTSKIAFYLVDLLTGESINIHGITNPQIAYGEDVLSRIHYAGNSRENLKKIRSGVLKAINLAIKKMCRESKVEQGDILEATLVGNTVMHHIFLGLPVKQLGRAPFAMATGESLEIKAREAGFDIYPGGYLYFPPPIAGFIGSDHLAMLIASGIETKKGNLIAIDIGTNTEIALRTKKRIISCSCASGPAFEGAHIKHGMRAASGAIERVNIDSRSLSVTIATIDDRAPLGICGSGILDGISEMLRVGIIDSSGKINPDCRGVRKTKRGKSLEFLLAKEGRREITITQQDISEIQLAKGAIRAGMEILLEEADLRTQDIDGVIVGGAFGTYIDPLKAMRIGMFPEINIGKFIQVGNGAGIGAKAILVSQKLREQANQLAKRIEHLELATQSNFFKHFTRAIRFPKSQRGKV